jgi:hypothetical protein
MEVQQMQEYNLLILSKKDNLIKEGNKLKCRCKFSNRLNVDWKPKKK